jgi:hypothetical protein
MEWSAHFFGKASLENMNKNPIIKTQAKTQTTEIENRNYPCLELLDHRTNLPFLSL